MNKGNIPAYVANKPQNIQDKYITMYNSLAQTEGKEVATIVSNKWLSRQPNHRLHSVEFELETTGGLFLRNDDGEEYMTFKLKGTEDKDGTKWSPKLLQKWADKINKGATIAGDIDHKLSRELYNSTVSAKGMEMILKKKPGIAKGIKAIVENGILYLRTVIDKRYKRLIQKAKGLSVETFVYKRDNDETIIDADLVGFTFNINTTPADAVTGAV